MIHQNISETLGSVFNPSIFELGPSCGPHYQITGAPPFLNVFFLKPSFPLPYFTFISLFRLESDVASSTNEIRTDCKIGGNVKSYV